MITIEIRAGKRKFRIENINNKFIFIQGNSGTGKTTLYQTIRDRRKYASIYRETIMPVKNAIDLDEFNFYEVPTELTALVADDDLSLDGYRDRLKSDEVKVYIMDEDHPLLHLKGYEEMLKTINSYFIIITRDIETFKNITFSPSDILYATYENKTTIYRSVYMNRNIQKDVYSTIITEDSKSSKIFFEEIFENKKVDVITAGGKDNLPNKCIEYLAKNVPMTIVYDYFGFGQHIHALEKILEQSKNIKYNIIDWNSFEYFIYSECRVVRSELNVDLKINSNKEHLAEVLLKSIVPTYSKSKIGCLASKVKKTCSSCTASNGCKIKAGLDFGFVLSSKCEDIILASSKKKQVSF